MKPLTRDELRLQLAATLTKTKIDKLKAILLTTSFNLCDLVDLTFDHDPVLGFRAAWLLDHALSRDAADHITTIDYLLARLPEVTNPSCKRHYARIVAGITSQKAVEHIKRYMAAINTEPLVEQCFNWVIDPKVLVAVKVHACEALCNMRQQHPWICDELPDQLHYLMRSGTAAIQARGRKLLGVLEV